MSNAQMEEDSEDDFDWEEVDIPAHQPTIEITLKTAEKKPGGKTKPNYHAERAHRLLCHKLHTLCLLANASVRNKWINDELLQARLLSLIPLPIQNSFAMIHKSRIPDPAKRGRVFQTSMESLVRWWTEQFHVEQYGHIRNVPYHEVQAALEARNLLREDATLDDETLADIMDDDGEVIRNEKSLMKHALLKSGSRDISAQLFTSLCRAMDIPARLVVSLQSVPWQASVGKPKPSRSRNGKAPSSAKLNDTDADLDEDAEAPLDNLSQSPSKMSKKARGKQRAKGPSQSRSEPSPSSQIFSSSLNRSNPLLTPPVFWTEVFSRADGRWMPVDPIRGSVNSRKDFDPTPWAATGQTTQLGRSTGSKPMPSRAIRDNRMVYVVALEEDGYARDVTRRYAREFAAKVSKVQGGPGGGGKGQRLWWDSIMSLVTRPYRLQRDDVEDTELLTAEMQEAMPSTMAGFKDHPLYALERHIKQHEIIHPPPPDTPELGKFKGEPVYPRSSVIPLKTAENWLRSQGRTICEGQQALKQVKYRAGTINRQRELEVFKDDLRTAGEGADNGEAMQGLYAFFQTEPYIPDPVVDGKIPKNNFGNVDLYVPSMLPRGAVHVPFKGTAKVARQLGLDFGEAVTGFEFKKRRAFPITEGIVVASENETVLLDAFWEYERQAEENAQRKREEHALKNWTQLIQGLRIRQRIQDQYADPQSSSPSKIPATNEKEVQDQAPNSQVQSQSCLLTMNGGANVATIDAVVQPYSLPKAQGPPEETDTFGLDTVSHTPALSLNEEMEPISLHTMDIDDQVSDPPIVDTFQRRRNTGAPRTMEELAQHEVATQRVQPKDVDTSRRLKVARRGRAQRQPTTSSPASRRKRRRGENSNPGSDSDSPAFQTSAPAPSNPSGRTLRPRKAKAIPQSAAEDGME